MLENDLDREFPIESLPELFWPEGLKNIPEPPSALNIRGLDNFKNLMEHDFKFLCIVGSRKYTDYGQKVCEALIPGLAGFKICLVSGLAYGIDSLVHQIALENKIPTIAFPGSGLDAEYIYPRAHFGLATDILYYGGCLISEFENDKRTEPWMFPQRNRLMAGISDATLIIEASEKSGTTITANMAVEYNRTLMSVPGSIFNYNSDATNRFIKNGAVPVTNSFDILEQLGFNAEEIETQNQNRVVERLSKREKRILKLMQNGITDLSEIIRETQLEISKINQIITKLEIQKLI
jgi:DNA processing protein